MLSFHFGGGVIISMLGTMEKMFLTQILGPKCHIMWHSVIKSEKVKKAQVISSVISVEFLTNVQNKCVQTRWNGCFISKKSSHHSLSEKLRTFP